METSTRIDQLLSRLGEEGADRLALVAGRPPILVRDDGPRPLDEKPLTRDAVAGMVGALHARAPNGEGQLPAEGRARFRSHGPSGPVRVQAEMRDDASRALIVPAGADGSAATVGSEAGFGQGGRGGDGPAGAPAGGREAGSETGDGGAGSGAERRLRSLLEELVERGGSDLHVSAGERPFFRKDGEMRVLEEEPVLSPSETREMVLSVAPERNRRQFEATRDTDFAYEIQGVARFRCNAFMDRRGVGGVFRQIPSEIWTAEELGLPEAVLELCELPKGLVVVTGPTGSGKSTTLAAMIDYINRHRRDHIITIEDPIEFTHENKGCLVNQREVGVHTEGFKVALRAALREDPDIVLIGEMRDLETVEIALKTAETGHLVFGTLHTNTAPSTVSRIIEQFPGEQQNQIRAMLSESLKGVIAQTLCRRKEGGRVAAMEILLINSAASNLIREGKTFQLPSVMQTSGAQGMRTLNDALVELVEAGTVAPEVAYRNAVAKDDFERALQRAGLTL